MMQIAAREMLKLSILNNGNSILEVTDASNRYYSVNLSAKMNTLILNASAQNG